MESLKETVRSAGLKQSEVARYLKISSAYLSQILGGTVPAPKDFDSDVKLAVLILSRAKAKAEEAYNEVIRSALDG